MSKEKFTDLPTVTNAALTDIICAVQGYISPSSPGISVQETLQQVVSLGLNNTILSNAGDPNGFVAGTTYQLCWDTTNAILYVCNNTGSTSTAVWKKSISLIGGTGITVSQNGTNIQISSSMPSGMSWNSTAASTVQMTSNNGYITSYNGTCVLTLPATSSVGDLIAVTGVGVPGTGWTIAQNAGQAIIIGNTISLVGTGGSVASTNRLNSLYLVCVIANTRWQQYGTQGELNVVTA